VLLYTYKAINNLGVTEEGMRNAIDEQHLVAELQAEGYIPIRIKPVNASSFLGLKLFGKKQLSSKDVALFTSELAVLLESGLPLDRSLNILLNLAENNEALTNFVSRVLDKVKGGASLTDALERRKSGGNRPISKIITKFYLSMIRAGEASGNLAEVLARLSSYLESSQELKTTVSTALIYPAILLVMSMVSLFVMLLFVVPQFSEMFASAGKALPISTQIVVGLAAGLRDYWWLVLGIGIGIYSYCHHQLNNPVTKKHWDARFLTMPLLGNIILNKETAHFTQTLGTLLANGVPLLTALAIARETLDNGLLIDTVADVQEQVKQGKTLSSVLSTKNVFPNMAVQMIKTGEETGRLEEMLLRIAKIHDKQLKVSIQRMLALLEPALILGLGLMIAGIIVSILLAILSVNDLAL
jgi:general secretion pathway protein F